jgi:hypothetical protein
METAAQKPPTVPKKSKIDQVHENPHYQKRVLSERPMSAIVAHMK